MTRSEAVKFVAIRTIGNFLVLFSIFGVIATFGPALYYEVSYRIILARGVTYKVPKDTKSFADILANEKEQKTRDGPSLADVLVGNKEQILIPSDTEFSILIPKIGASARIIANTDPQEEKIFQPVLLEGIAHAKGTVFPGIAGNTYLFAHSADNFWDVGRYNAVFYLLKDLKVGDDVIVFFHNVRYNYVVSDSKILDAKDTSAIINSHGGEETLILQTCWPPGTTWKRLLVYAKPK